MTADRVEEARERKLRELAFVAIRDGEAWHDRRLPEMGRALNETLDRVAALETALRGREDLLREWMTYTGLRARAFANYHADLAEYESGRDLIRRTDAALAGAAEEPEGKA